MAGETRNVKHATIGTLAIVLAAASPAHAALVIVDATDSIYAGAVGSTPAVVVPIGQGATVLTFAATGFVTVNVGTGNNQNDADGVGSAQGITVSSSGFVSGISASTAGFLAGVFIGPGLGSAPAILDFRSGGLGTSFSSLSPSLGQAFFIGDGLSGNGAGSRQTFNIPVGADTLLLGLADANSYSGPPSAYGDNAGAFAVTVRGAEAVAAVPEPATWAMMLMGFGAIGYAMRRRPKVRTNVSFA